MVIVLMPFIIIIVIHRVQAQKRNLNRKCKFLSHLHSLINKESMELKQPQIVQCWAKMPRPLNHVPHQHCMWASLGGNDFGKAALWCWGKSPREGRGGWHLKNICIEGSLTLGQHVLHWWGIREMKHISTTLPVMHYHIYDTLGNTV